MLYFDFDFDHFISFLAGFDCFFMEKMFDKRLTTNIKNEYKLYFFSIFCKKLSKIDTIKIVFLLKTANSRKSTKNNVHLRFLLP